MKNLINYFDWGRSEMDSKPHANIYYIKHLQLLTKMFKKVGSKPLNIIQKVKFTCLTGSNFLQKWLIKLV